MYFVPRGTMHRTHMLTQNTVLRVIRTKSLANDLHCFWTKLNRSSGDRIVTELAVARCRQSVAANEEVCV
jgi:hypothetical protein